VNTRNIDAMFSVACSAHGSALPFCEWRGVSFLCRDYFYRRKPLSLSLLRERVCARSLGANSVESRFLRELAVYHAVQNSRGVTARRLHASKYSSSVRYRVQRRDLPPRRPETRGPIITIGARSEKREKGRRGATRVVDSFSGGGPTFPHFPHFSPPRRYAQHQQQPQRSSQAAALRETCTSPTCARERYGIT